MQRLFTLIFLTICLGSSCCKKEPDPVDRPIPADMKAYWDFKLGSWWAYQDSATGAIDTVKVTEYNNYRFNGTLISSGVAANCEYLEILTYNTGDQYYNDYWINTSAAGTAYPDYNVVFRSKYGTPGTEGGNKCFVFPLIIENKTYNPLGSVFDTTTVKVVGDTLLGYNDVTAMYQNRNTVDGDQHTSTYWAKNVGIVKLILVDSAVTKTLISYQLNP